MNSTAKISPASPTDLDEARTRRKLRVEERKASREQRKAEARAAEAEAAGRDGDATRERAEFAAAFSASFERIGRAMDRLAGALEAATVGGAAVDELRREFSKMQSEQLAAAARRADAANDPSKRYVTADEVKTLIAAHDKKHKA